MQDKAEVKSLMAQEEGGPSKLERRLACIRHKILVLSGKGGVGKSTVAVNLAVTLAASGNRVGLLDIDIHGPSVPTMLGLEDAHVQAENGDILPVEKAGLKVLSLGFFLANHDEAIIWRGPRKMTAIRQLLEEAAWGDLDYLIVDSPPGTGDEPLSACQLLGNVDGAIIVTTPQRVAAVDVRKSITFCRQLDVPVLGVVENMSGFACPHCGEISSIFGVAGGRQMSEEMGIPFLGAIPICPSIATACDEGRPFDWNGAPQAKPAWDAVCGAVSGLEREKTEDFTTYENDTRKDGKMRIAIPLADGKLTLHFGHCERFALIDVDRAASKILKREDVEAPQHQPGLFPRWLAEQGATMIIAGGMGQRAQELFAEQGIEVMTGAPSEPPESIVQSFLADTLQTGGNTCDH